MQIIGLTGGIGCGKSMVIKLLQDEYDAEVLIADEIGHMAMQTGTETFHRMVESFGSEILDEKGELHRERMASIIFSDSDKLKEQNAIIHPFVWEKIQKEIKNTKKDLVIIESAILIEAGYRDICDDIWLISSEESIRRERLKQHRGYSDEKIDAIIKQQWTKEEYLKYCKKVIYNNKDIDNLREQLKKLLE